MAKLARNENLTTTLTKSINELTGTGEFSKVRRKVIRLCNRMATKIRNGGRWPEVNWKPVLEDTHKPVRDYARICARPKLKD